VRRRGSALSWIAPPALTPGCQRTRASNETMKSIGGWYGVSGHDANLSFRAPHDLN
jgi:hypothetical protein